MNYPLTLEQYIAQMPMQEAELARMGAQIAEALSVIHQQGRVHGDVKPGNILVVSPGNYQLIGYENVRQYPEGTIPTFVAPELTQGGAYHAGTDVYALGMLMKSLIPKQGISGVFDEIIQKACEPDPARPLCDGIGICRGITDACGYFAGANGRNRAADVCTGNRATIDAANVRAETGAIIETANLRAAIGTAAKETVTGAATNRSGQSPKKCTAGGCI